MAHRWLVIISLLLKVKARAREIAEYRRRVIREKEAVVSARGSVEQMLSAIAAGKLLNCQW